MTVIKIYPLWNQAINIYNFVKYATDNGFTIASSESHRIEEDGTSYATLVTVQTITGAQQTIIKSLFAGTANIIFS